MNEDIEHLQDVCQYHEALLGTRLLAEREGADDEIFAAMQRLELARSRMNEREQRDAKLSYRQLQTQFGLSATEMYGLWLLVSIAIEPRVRSMLATLFGTSNDPTIGEIKTVVYGTTPSRDALVELGPAGTLRRFGLIERSDGGTRDLHESRRTWAISRRVLEYLHGRRDELLPRGCRIRSGSEIVAACDLKVATRAIDQIRRALRDGEALVIVTGLPGLGRRTLVWSLANELEKPLLEVDATKLATDVGELADQLREIAVVARVAGRSLLLANIDALSSERWEVVRREFLPLQTSPLVMTSGPAVPAIEWDQAVTRIDVDHPTSSQRAELWWRSLGGTAEDADILASIAPLAPALICKAATAALSAAGDGPLDMEHVMEGVRSVTQDQLSKFATRIAVSQSWEDVVLPSDHADAVEDLLRRIRGRRRVYEEWGFGAKVGKGFGIAALFSGPPGTGKTMVASLIAKDLGTDLYAVDMSKVVSKYIGETEKNLAALFDAADATAAVLLFDEADALFGKRTEVKSSNDRNANLETNFLLQRLERFQGVCLLTTNHQSNLDPAFERRMAMVLRFAIPEAWEREHIWQAVLPKQAPVALPIAFSELARRYEMSGGYIKNAALRAAFMAAHENSPITMTHLERAARMEYEAMGKLSVSVAS